MDSHTHESDERLDRFVKWLARHGFDHEGAWYSSSVRVRVFPDCQGFGFVASRSIEHGQVILAVPEKLLMSTRTARACNEVQQVVAALARLGSSALSDLELLNVHLVLERLRGAASFWHEYIDMLPRFYSLLAAFDEHELGVVPEDGVAAAFVALARSNRAQVTASFERIRRAFELAFRGSSEPSRQLTFELYLWAHCTVLSRTCHVPFDTVGALVPFGDFLNHEAIEPSSIVSTASASDGSTERQSRMPRLNQATGMYEFYAHRTFHEGEQVFVCYASSDNLHLLEFYGFALENNPYERVPITLPEPYEMDPSARTETAPPSRGNRHRDRRHPQPDAKPTRVRPVEPSNTTAMRRAAEAAMHLSDIFVYSNGPSFQALCALRIRAMDESELRRKLQWRALQGEEISERNEALVRAFLSRFNDTQRAILQAAHDAIVKHDATNPTGGAIDKRAVARIWLAGQLAVLDKLSRWLNGEDDSQVNEEHSDEQQDDDGTHDDGDDDGDDDDEDDEEYDDDDSE